MTDAPIIPPQRQVIGDAMPVRVSELGDPVPWRTYLEQRDSGGLYHRVEWDSPFAVYGLRVTRLVAWRGEQVVGILPLVRQRSLLFGNRFTSLPWFDTAGVLSDDHQAAEALVSRATALASQYRLNGLLLRQAEPVPDWPEDRADKVLMRLGLLADPDVLWKKFSPKVRNQVRKGEKAGLVVESGGIENLSDFHAVYSANMRDLGSPCHSRRFFGAVMEAFATDAQIHVARLEGQVVGAGLTLRNGKWLEIPWASSLRRFNSLCVNHVLYWHMLRHACLGGFEWFHFGRSSIDSGTYHFKKQWGAEPKPLFWYQLSTDGTPIASTRSLQDGYGWATRVWRQLPLRVTQWVGPRMIARLP